MSVLVEQPWDTARFEYPIEMLLVLKGIHGRPETVELMRVQLVIHDHLGERAVRKVNVTIEIVKDFGSEYEIPPRSAIDPHR